MKERPWIWLIIVNVLIVAGLSALVTIAVKNKPQEVPAVHAPTVR